MLLKYIFFPSWSKNKKSHTLTTQTLVNKILPSEAKRWSSDNAAPLMLLTLSENRTQETI